MPVYSKNSKQKLLSCHPELQRLFFAVIEYYDCMILIGHRKKKEQDEAFRSNKSKFVFPDSNHNSMPSKAVDAIPWFRSEPHIRWDDIKKFYQFGGFVQGVSKVLGINIRWGGNWDMDDELHDQKFFDLVHFEVIEKHGN